MPLCDRLGLGNVSFQIYLFFHTEYLIHQVLVIGAFFQAGAFLVQFIAVPFKFPIFALSFALKGVGNVLQVNIILIHKEVCATNNLPFDSFQNASANSFIATLQQDSEYKQGFIQAAYGTIIPLQPNN